jgi:hypothetical protein
MEVIMMNKKYLLTALLSVMAAAMIFAAGNSYKVQSVVGKVQYEAAPGTWKTVTKGQELAPSAVVNTGLNSKLVLVLGDKTITIKPMQKGTIEKLALASDGGKKGITKGEEVAKSDVKDEDTKTTKGVATAASRASEAKEDVDWDEE